MWSGSRLSRFPRIWQKVGTGGGGWGTSTSLALATSPLAPGLRMAIAAQVSKLSLAVTSTPPHPRPSLASVRPAPASASCCSPSWTDQGWRRAAAPCGSPWEGPALSQASPPDPCRTPRPRPLSAGRECSASFLQSLTLDCWWLPHRGQEGECSGTCKRGRMKDWSLTWPVPHPPPYLYNPSTALTR